MSDLSKMSRDELEHAAIQEQMGNVITQMNSGFEIMENRLNDILKQTKKTNGRVAELEDTTDFIKVLKKYKWLLVLTLIGIYTIFDTVNLNKLIDKFW